MLINTGYTWQIEKTKNNLDTLIINGKYIHSKFNPLIEGENFRSKPNNLVLIFGLGLAYHVNNIIKNNPDSAFIIFEPIKEIFDLGQNYIEKELLSKNKNKVCLLNDISNIRLYDFILNNNFITGNRIQIFTNLGYKSLFPDQEEYFLNTVKKNLELVIQNTLTESHFIPLWTKNILINLNNCIENPIINPKSSDLKNNLAVIASAGPNLTSDIPYLIKFRDKITIFAVDTALKTLISYKIFPDFVISLDSQYYSLDDFVNKKLDEVYFIFDLSCYPKISKLYKNVYFTLTDNIYDNNIIEYAFISLNIPRFGITSGGNVSDYALSLVLKFGFKNIYFSGLDLSFPYLQTHSKNSPFFDRSLNLSNYLETQETIIMSALSLRELKEFKSRINNKNILSDFVLLNYSNYLNDFALINNDINFYYQFAYGLNIPNFKVINLPDLINKLDTKRQIRDSIINNSIKFYLLKDNLQDFYIKLANDIHVFALKLNDFLNSTDFNSNEKLNHAIQLFKDVFNSFAFLKKFILITEIILDKKNINADNILYYKHTLHKTLQSIYFIIRVIQKILLLF